MKIDFGYWHGNKKYFAQKIKEIDEQIVSLNSVKGQIESYMDKTFNDNDSVYSMERSLANPLYRVGINFLSELASLTKRQAQGIRGLGDSKLLLLESEMTKRNVSFKKEGEFDA